MSTIITRNSATSGSVPSSLVQGELAINVKDGRLFYGSGSANVVKEFGLTSSFALSASYAATASLAPLYLPLAGGTISGNVTVLGTASINTLIVNQIGYSSGSNQLGDAANDTQTLYGTVVIPTGSLNLNGFPSGSVLFTSGLTGTVTSSANLYWDNPNGYLKLNGNASTGRISFYYPRITGYLNGIHWGDTDASPYGYIALDRGTGEFRQYTSPSYFPTYYSSGAEAMRISTNRNVLIGTTSDLARLQVRGLGATSATTALRVENANASSSLVVLDNGFVGINTGSAQTNLDVNGTARVVNRFLAQGGISFTSLTPETGNGGLIYASGNGMILQGYGASSGNDRYGRVYVGNVTATSNFLSYFVGTTIGTNSTVFGATSDSSNITTYFYFGSNLSNIVSSAIVNIDSTTKGFLPPRTNLTSNISTPAQGLITYVTASATEGLYYYNSGSYQGWTRVLNNTGSQEISGSLTITGSIFNLGNSRFAAAGGTSTLSSNALTSAPAIFYQNGFNGAVAIGGYSNSGGEIQGYQNGGISVGGTLYLQRQGGAVGIGGTNTSATLDVTGTGRFSTNLGVGRLATSSLDVAGTTRISGSFNTATSGSILTVIGSGSAQPIFTVQGSQGELFSITDSLSGSLFSVNDISGLPILEVFSDNTTLIGNYQDPMLITTAKVVQTNSGSFTMYSLPTASYDTAFFEYSIRSGSNARAGTIMAVQLGSTVNFTETTTTDFGNTSAVSFTVIVTGSNMALTGSSTSGAWTIKTIVRGL